MGADACSVGFHDSTHTSGGSQALMEQSPGEGFARSIEPPIEVVLAIRARGRRSKMRVPPRPVLTAVARVIYLFFPLFRRESWRSAFGVVATAYDAANTVVLNRFAAPTGPCIMLDTGTPLRAVHLCPLLQSVNSAFV